MARPERLSLELQLKLPDEDQDLLSEHTEGPNVTNVSSADEYQSSSDDDTFLAEGFDEDNALMTLLNSITNVRTTLSAEAQRQIGLEIGPHVSSEMPWKQVTKEMLENCALDDSTEVDKLKDRIRYLGRDDLILMGYIQKLSEDDDTFLVFDNAEAAKQAADIIRCHEAFFRRKIVKSFVKYPKEWKSMGSEQEMTLLMEQPVTNVKDVELQMVYPMRDVGKKYSFRKADDARDGYVELLPGKVRFDNVIRKRIDMAVQSAPPRVSLEQQTDPTFPTNAWSQYLYEIRPQEAIAEEEGDLDDFPPVKSRDKDANEEPGEVELSDGIKLLMNILEFNHIDMYKNDYPFITNKQINKSEIPVLRELFCFADLSKTVGRFVSCFDWHPTFSGVIVAAYTFSTFGSAIDKHSAIDPVQRIVIEPNPVLVWSFEDDLHYKLSLQSPREVMAISYCPYDGDLIIGGFANGQIVIWDLKDRLERVESEEILTADQVKYRNEMRSFLAWTKEEDRNVVVLPAAISSLEYSHKAAVTSIQWINRKTYVSEGGQMRERPDSNKDYRFFATTSMDGNICFWDLDGGAGDETARKHVVKRPRKLPPGFVQQDSEYKIFDKIFRPTFTLVVKQPISRIIMDHALFEYTPINPPAKQKLFMRLNHSIREVPQEPFRNKITIATFLGNIATIQWNGFDYAQGGTEVNKEEISQIEYFCKVNAYPVMEIQKNPFISNLFLCVGYTSLSVWHEDFKTSPIFYRRRDSFLTGGMWSKNRPSVFFIIRTDGTCEAWDILAKTDGPCLTNSFGGKILTSITQHNLTLPQEAIAIGDHNSSIWIVILPAELVRPVNNELELLTEFIAHEIKRKSDFELWKTKWFEDNKDIILARNQAANEQRLELEKLEKELKEQEEVQQRLAEAEEAKRRRQAKSRITFDLPERLEKKWDEMNFRRLMKLLMERRQVDQKLLDKQTKPLKELMRYSEKKRDTIKESFTKISKEIAEVRARLLPTESQEIDLNTVAEESVAHLMTSARNFEEIEEESIAWIAENRGRHDLAHEEILRRARNRRDVLNQSLGGNIEHRLRYFMMKEEDAQLDQPGELLVINSDVVSDDV